MTEIEIPMVNSGGESTMLGQWRIVLRQAEEAARLGRFEEAYALASRPDVSDHHNAVQLRGRLALELIGRATRRGASDDLRGAIDDLALAERMGAPPDSLAAARLNLADQVAKEIRDDLESGEPTRVLERIEELARHKISGPALRRSREIAEAWQSALAEGRRGEFGHAQEQLDRAERLATGTGGTLATSSLAAAKVDLENRQKAAGPKIEVLYAALAAGEWPRTLTAAEAVLALVPEHPAARQARSRAWQQIAAIGPSTAAQWPARGTRSAQAAAPASPPFGFGVTSAPAAARGMNRASDAVGHEIPFQNATPARAPEIAPRRPFVFTNETPIGGHPNSRSAVEPKPGNPLRPLARAEADGLAGRFLLWVDAVGGYLVCLDDQIVLGRAGNDSHADVPLMGDLSRRHAILSRNGDGYVLHAEQASYVNGKPVADQIALRDGDVIRLGSTVELEFRQPSPVSATARLAIVSRHRLPLAVDGVLLMADTCIIGDVPQAHIPAPSIKDPVVLYRQAGSLWCRAAGAFDVDGRTCAARAPLDQRSSVLGDGFSFSLEPLESHPV
jgi:hypothetical protein